jgi:UDP-GlcNAc:undecaprenyl-phosphate GlcNAc-1-phosphate transferase
MHWALASLYVFDFAFVLALVLTPLCRRLSHQSKFLLSPPHEHGQAPIPLTGGIAVFGAIALTVVINFVFILPWLGSVRVPFVESAVLQRDVARGLDAAPRLAVIFTSAAAVLLMGIYADKHHLGPRAKLVGHVMLAALLAMAGMRLTFEPNEFVSVVVTIVWIVIVVHAMTHFDRADGLCVSVALASALLFALIAGARGQGFVALLALAVAGALVGFLPYNFKPASISLGENGSATLGFCIASLPLLIRFDAEGANGLRAVLISLVILCIPLVEFIAAMQNKERPRLALRLVQLGFSLEWAVGLVTLTVLAMGLIAVGMLWLNVWLVLAQVLAAAGVVAILLRALATRGR